MSLVDFLVSVKRNIPGLQSLSLTDREGVVVYDDHGVTIDSMEVANDELQILSVIFSLTHEQCQKLEEFGETNYLITEYMDGSSLLQANVAPLLLSMKAKGVNRQILIDAADQCKVHLKDLRRRVAASTVD